MVGPEDVLRVDLRLDRAQARERRGLVERGGVGLHLGEVEVAPRAAERLERRVELREIASAFAASSGVAAIDAANENVLGVEVGRAAAGVAPRDRATEVADLRGQDLRAAPGAVGGDEGVDRGGRQRRQRDVCSPLPGTGRAGPVQVDQRGRRDQAERVDLGLELADRLERPRAERWSPMW